MSSKMSIIIGILSSIAVLLTTAVIVFVIDEKTSTVAVDGSAPVTYLTLPVTSPRATETLKSTSAGTKRNVTKSTQTTTLPVTAVTTATSTTAVSTTVATVATTVTTSTTSTTTTLTISTTTRVTAQAPKKLPQETDFYPQEINSSTYPRIYYGSMQKLLQSPELPTGCEVTALTALLNYLGYDVSKTELADNYLPQAPAGESDFHNAFIGSPYDKKGYGCYAPVIKYTAQRFLLDRGSQREALNLTGTNFEKLLPIISKDIPVVCWVSQNLIEMEHKNDIWEYDGKQVDWLAGEHAVVIDSYNLDKNLVYVIDPQKGRAIYDYDLFKLRYNQLGKQAVVII